MVPPPYGLVRDGLDPFGILDAAQAALGGGDPPAGPVVASGIASAGSSPTTGAIDMTGADLIVVVITGYNLPGAGAITDSEGNTWIAGPVNLGATRSYQRTYYCINPTVSSAQTFGSTTSSLFGSILVAGFAGFGSAAYDFNSSGGANAVSSVNAGIVTPSASGALAVSGFASHLLTTLAVPDSGFAVLEQAGHVTSVHIQGAIAYKIIPDTSAVNLGWSWSGSYAASATILGFV